MWLLRIWYTFAKADYYYKSIYIAPHEEWSTEQKMKPKKENKKEQKLWKQGSFHLPLEHRRLRFT